MYSSNLLIGSFSDNIQRIWVFFSKLILCLAKFNTPNLQFRCDENVASIEQRIETLKNMFIVELISARKRHNIGVKNKCIVIYEEINGTENDAKQ